MIQKLTDLSLKGLDRPNELSRSKKCISTSSVDNNMNYTQEDSASKPRLHLTLRRKLCITFKS